MNNTVVGLGEILWDVFPERKVLGGAPANFAYHVSQFGYNGYAASAVGDDLLGKEILSSLAEKDLNYVIEVTDYPTGTVKVTLNKTGVPEYEICENVAWDNIPFTAKLENLAKNTGTVSFGSLAQRNSVSKETVKKFLAAMPENSVKIFDINLRQHFYTKELIHESLQLANMLKINDEEVIIVAELFDLKDDNEQDICKLLLERYNLDIVILTKGTEGSFVFTSKETSFQPTPKVHVADTVGAGDSFTAAFVASYMHGERIADAHQLAMEVSAYVCTQHGAMPRLPDAYLELFRNK
ncbi:carbohydrate kinase [Dysgonomonas sp. ZJ709]|uniref:carbohydrate kinase family protein n=1 Tax=Dysgonomonas sp. ZJ709 TaxID=2709797 RepID=UPI0013EE15ED|nr:carbohydrate kinase [Dysgonomonas sp. ZJ709]